MRDPFPNWVSQNAGLGSTDMGECESIQRLSDSLRHSRYKWPESLQEYANGWRILSTIVGISTDGMTVGVSPRLPP